MSSLIKEEDRRQRQVRKEHIVGSVAPLLDLVAAAVAAPARRVVSQQFTKGNWRSRRRDAAVRRRDGGVRPSVRVRVHASEMNLATHFAANKCLKSQTGKGV